MTLMFSTLSTLYLSPGIGVTPRRFRKRKPQELALERQPCQRCRSRESLGSSLHIACHREGRTADIDEHRRYIVVTPLTNRWLRDDTDGCKLWGAAATTPLYYYERSITSVAAVKSINYVTQAFFSRWPPVEKHPQISI